MKKHSVIYPSKTERIIWTIILAGMPLSAIVATILALCGVNQ